MKFSCIQQPKNDRYIQVSEWQVKFCQGNHCTAFILAHFIAWHDWKLHHDEYYQRANNIAEQHGGGRSHDQNAYLFFSIEDLSEGILGSYGRNSILNALQELEKFGVISIHKNPNPRYQFDKTKYFIFHPEVCNVWIEENYSDHILEQAIDPSGHLKLNDRFSEIKPPSFENKRPLFKKGRAITNTTNNPTKNNVLLNTRERLTNEIEKKEAKTETGSVDTLVGILKAQGLQVNSLNHVEVYI